MMTRINDTTYPANPETHSQAGLTKLEYFTAMAMQGIVATMANCYHAEQNHAVIAEAAVKIARATINKLNQ